MLAAPPIGWSITYGPRVYANVREFARDNRVDAYLRSHLRDAHFEDAVSESISGRWHAEPDETAVNDTLERFASPGDAAKWFAEIVDADSLGGDRMLLRSDGGAYAFQTKTVTARGHHYGYVYELDGDVVLRIYVYRTSSVTLDDLKAAEARCAPPVARGLTKLVPDGLPTDIP
jgi:hypothetical protein